MDPSPTKPWWRRWFGTRSERSALRFLKQLGYRILARNYTCLLGEIDIIALDGTCVVFVEVRSTEHHSADSAAASVDHRKQQRLTRLALLYLQKNRLLEQRARFDVLTISWPPGRKKPTITHIPAAFEATGGKHQFFLLIDNLDGALAMFNHFLPTEALRALLFILFVGGSVWMVRADYPPVAKLPSQADLPDPLVMLDGTRITTREAWNDKRKPELKGLFQHYMYGTTPPRPKVDFKVERVDLRALGGKATLKEVTISFGPPGTPKIHLLLVVPNKRTGPAPVFVGMNFRGNHTVLDDPNIALPTAWVPNAAGAKNNKAADAGRGTEVKVWNIEQTIDQGYAVATFYCGDIDPDRADVREGIQEHLRKEGETYDWGSVPAWAWGIERVIDYLVTDPDLDRNGIIVVGHSRLGKTALLAGAFDDRVAMVIPLQAGCGGTAPSRGKIGESVKQINDRFPHWFNGTFKEFNDKTDRLPFDQHCLVALMAPRPVLFGNAVEDTWANPAGQFQVLQGADPVYKLFKTDGLAAKKMPEVGVLVDSTLGYYIRNGKHSMNAEDWRFFVQFADKHLKKAGGR